MSAQKLFNGPSQRRRSCLDEPKELCFPDEGSFICLPCKYMFLLPIWPLKYLIAWALPDKKQPFSISYYSKQENNEGLRTTALGWEWIRRPLFLTCSIGWGMREIRRWEESRRCQVMIDWVNWFCFAAILSCSRYLFCACSLWGSNGYEWLQGYTSLFLK